MVDVRPRSHQRNHPLFRVQDFVWKVDGYLDAQRFGVVVACTNDEVEFRDEQSWRKRNRKGVCEDRWEYAQVKAVEYELQVPFDMPYALKWDELRWVNAFNSRLD